jgi:voltage-gated potassium channel
LAELRHKVYCELFAGAKGEDSLTLTSRILVAAIIVAVLFAVLSTEPEIVGESPAFFFWAEIGFGVIFGIEYLARVWTVPEKDGPGSATAKRLKFMTSPMGIIDLVVVIASLAPFMMTNIALLRIVRLLRIAALAKFGRFSRSLQELWHALVQRRFDLLVTMALAAALLLFGATALYWAERDVQPEAFGSIPRALWWSIITLTTVGYGDVSPVTPIGKFLASIVALGGIGLVAMPTGIMAAAFSDAMEERRRKEEAEREALIAHHGETPVGPQG